MKYPGDPEWNYVNVRRYFIYLEHSIDLGTQWAVFEPNDEPLWANVRNTITAFFIRNGSAVCCPERSRRRLFCPLRPVYDEPKRPR
ncbi:MAG: hypothetical protein K8R23_13145 [Chthoniobacter sp.]|nr:hypothetical protein [Chthoniobacter sp.]